MMAVLLILLLLTLTDAATGLFWKQHKHVGQSMTWTDAQAHCTNTFRYVGLSVIDSQSDYDNLRRQIRSGNGWIGLTKQPKELDFTQWVDGQKLEFTMWKNDQPDKLYNEHCVYLNNAEWENCKCSDGKNFFCYTWAPQLIVVQEMKTWEEALMHCRTHYTDLVSLTNEIDYFVVNNRSAEILTPAIWTSLRFMDGSWFWVNEQSLVNVTALPSCPANPFRCGARNHKNGVWENRDCEEKMNFICYK